jgi:hypothetical protein
VLAVLAGVLLSLLSTFVGARSATATYPDIMGCEQGCQVTATGWPLVFVRDYTGMSVVKTADILEVWFAADRFDWAPFGANLAFWSLLCFVVLAYFERKSRAR